MVRKKNEKLRSSKGLFSDMNFVRLLTILIVVVVALGFLTEGKFVKMRVFTQMGYLFPEYGVMAVAIMLAMITGGIDLSQVGIANLSSIAGAMVFLKVMPQELLEQGGGNGYIFLAVLAALATGVACGFLNGVLISKVGIPPILTTLGSQQLFIGLGKVITGGPAVSGFPDMLIEIGSYKLFNVIPLPMIVFFTVIAIFSFIMNKTSYGTKLYMMGSNKKAAEFSGIKASSITLKTYVICGVLASIAGILIMAKTNSAKPDYGTSFTLQVILISVLGGVNPNGGFGKISGIVLAILILQSLSTGLSMLKIPSSVLGLIWGGALIIIMIVNFTLNGMENKRRIKELSYSSQK
jgi:simple sugar transport system permease protein